MDSNALALLIHDNPASAEPIRQALGGDASFKFQSVDRVATALARLAGGGVDVVILDRSYSKTQEIEILDTLLKLRSAAPKVPIIVVGDSEADGLVVRAIRAGTAHYLAKDRCGPDLRGLVYSALDNRREQRDSHLQRTPPSRNNGNIVMVLGAKGGVGATTVALNLACALAQSKRVILAELQPAFGTLSQYFRPHCGLRNVSQLLKADPAAIRPPDAEQCLWPYKNVPGLNILFGPWTAEQCGEIGPNHAKAISKALSALADYVVLDLPTSLTEANRAVLADSDLPVLVVERDPFSVESGQRVLETIRNGVAIPPRTGSVIVNRAPLALPMELAQIEMQLAIPILGVIPPAPDLCIAAQMAGAPLVLFDPESLAARSFIVLAGRIASRH